MLSLRPQPLECLSPACSNSFNSATFGYLHTWSPLCGVVHTGANRTHLLDALCSLVYRIAARERHEVLTLLR
jgi:hypothetical protein